MRRNRRPGTGRPGPNATYGLRKTLAGSALAVAVTVAAVAALSAPLVVGAVVAGGAVAVGARRVAGRVGGLPRELVRRVTGGGTRRVCVPHTGVCVKL